MMDKTSFAARIKDIEGMEAGRRFLPGLPVLARLDGRNFSRLTRGLKKPYDERLVEVMKETTRWLVDETCAGIGYTQSDEITLLFRGDKNGMFFDGKIHKMVSVLASMGTAKFNQLAPLEIDGRFPMAMFDCRAWMVPSKMEAVNCILWREVDATRNSITGATRSYYSHNQMYKKSCPEMQEMLWQKGVNWDMYPAFFKRGTYVWRKKVFKTLSDDELASIPQQHRPTGPVERTIVEFLDMPPLSKVTNRVEVMFDGAKPIVASEELSDGQGQALHAPPEGNHQAVLREQGRHCQPETGGVGI